MLHYLCQGLGKQTLVLIHGYCENNTCFNEQVLFFTGNRKVITIDLPGFGESEAIANVSMEIMASEVKNVLDHLQVEKCVMMGHSMGGYVTLAFAELYPEILEGFGLIHSVASADNTDRKEKRKQVIEFVKKHGSEPYVKNFIPDLFAPQNKEKPFVAAFIKQGLTSSADGIIAAAQAMMNRPDRIHVLQNTKLPVFFGIGKLDTLIPEKTMFLQASYCIQSQICYLKNSGHLGMVEESDSLNKGILSFCESLTNI